ncbi:MAG: hypothetical protein R6V14_01750, partial [Halanaerobiales bacterium]
MNNKVKTFLTAVFTVFLAFLIMIFNIYSINNNIWEIVFFTIILLFLSNLSEFINFESSTSTSISLPVLIPAITILNPFIITLIAFVGTSELSFGKEKIPWYKFFFNRCVIGLSAGMAAYTYRTSLDIITSNILIALFFSSVIYFVINSGLVYAVIYFSGEEQKISYRVFLNELFKSIFMSYFLGLILYFSYIQFG